MQKYFHKVPSFSLHIRFHLPARALISGSFLSKSNECIVNGAGRDRIAVKELATKKNEKKKKRNTFIVEIYSTVFKTSFVYMKYFEGAYKAQCRLENA